MQSSLANLLLALSISSLTALTAYAGPCEAPAEPAAGAFERLANPKLGPIRDYLASHAIAADAVDAQCRKLYAAAIATKNDALVLEVEAASKTPISLKERATQGLANTTAAAYANYYEFALGHGSFATIQRLKAEYAKLPSRALVSDLGLAARENTPDVIDAMISAGADPNGVFSDGSTVLMHAAYATNDPAVIDVLVRRGARVDEYVGTEKDETALIVSAFNPNPKIVEALLRNGAKVDGTAFRGKTALIMAARAGNLATTKVLIEAGANVNAAMRGGDTVLIHAALGGSPEVVETLLRAGANPNAKENQGATALFFAVEARKNSKAVIEALLKGGADKTIKASNGRSPYEHAEMNSDNDDRDAILALLKI